MSDRYAISTDKVPKPIGPYSQAIVSGGFVFVAGQGAFDPKTGQRVGDTIEEQTRQTLENIRAVLEEAGTDMAHVVKTTCFLADIALFERFNAVYREYFPDPPPARSTVQAVLPANFLVEIEAIARLPADD